MQFIDQNPVLVNVRIEDADYNPQGRKIKTLRRRLFAKFSRGIPPWAVPLAETRFDFSHLPPDRTAEQSAGFYDSEADQQRMGWDDEERAKIEQTLVEKGYLVVEKPKAPLPYPTYAKQRKVQGKRTLEHVISEITATLDATGIDSAAVVAYEADHFDKDSQTIIDAFAVPDEAETEDVVLA